LTVRFWGVRAHIPVPGPETAEFGGNTACVEVRCGRDLLIFDAGTGIRPLGQSLLREAPLEADLFFSHSQFDRICGLPFFAPAFNPRNRFRIWAGHLEGDDSIKGVLTQLMVDPIFPVPLTAMKAALDFRDFRAGDTLSPRTGITVRTVGFNWTRPVTGYRVEYAGKTACYLSDIKNNLEVNVPSVVDLIDGADIVVFNVALDPSMESPGDHDGWRWGVDLCARAGARTLILTGHRHGDDDRTLDRLAAEARRLWPTAIVAREGLTIEA
jgi:phosphoribosyl 1,2-cyclic phosphodiesterase